MLRTGLALLSMCVPALGIACDSSSRARCKEVFTALISYRTEAIETAFGDIGGVLPKGMKIEFMSSRDPQYANFAGMVIYDRPHHTLIFPRAVLGAKTPYPLRWAAYYWPFYQHEQYRQEYPVIETVDNALWAAFLQEAARTRNLSWPHQDCASVDMSKRLPCEMVVAGIGEFVKARRGPLFNANRLDMIWPEDFAKFLRRVWQRADSEYTDVQRYGGILLVEPLINEFGVPRTLVYLARTPFRIEDNNVHLSALRYQERAREFLSSDMDQKPIRNAAAPPVAAPR